MVVRCKNWCGLKIFQDSKSKLLALCSTWILEGVIFFDMATLRKRRRRTAWHDLKQDHWLAQAALGLCLVALAFWLVVLHRGYEVAS